MPTPTYIPLGTITLSSTASTVTFSSIPATYRDLILIYNGVTSGSGGNLQGTFNSDSGSNYSLVTMRSDNGSVGSETATTGFFYGNVSGLASTDRYETIWQIMDYSATDKHKTLLIRVNMIGSTTDVAAYAQRWANTAAIHTIALQAGSTSFAIGSTFSLFGVN